MIEVERDFTTYGDEIKFGGGKTIQDSMGQSPTVTRTDVRSGKGLNVVIEWLERQTAHKRAHV